jgi:TolA-binding protein
MSGQLALNERNDAQLVAELEKRMETSLIEARPVLLELVKRFSDKPERESYVFLLGLSFQDEYAETEAEGALRSAVEYYNEYLNDFPRGSRVDFVRFNLANAYADLEEYADAIKFFDLTYRQSDKAVYRTESRNRMAALYIRSDRAADGIPLFLEVFSTAALDPELRAQAAAWLIQGYLAADQSEKITGYLRYLAAPYEAVYDPAFNITLVKSGDTLFEKGNYDRAILLYSFVKKRAEIVRFYRDLVADLRQKVRYINAETDQFIVVDGQLKAAEARLAAVEEIRQYDVDLMWRIARVYKETERTWESLWAFVHLYEDFPEHENVEIFLYTAYEEAKKVGDLVMAEQLAFDYLAMENFQKFRGQVITGLARIYADGRRYDELMELANDYLSSPKDFRIAAQLVNIVNSYYMVDAEYLEVRSFSTPLRDRFSGREPLFEATRYWTSLALLLLADYQRASESMATFIDDYSERSVYYEDVFYRYGVALFGEQKEREAEAQFLRFTDTFPSSNLRGEAELYIGDLKRSRGAFEDATVHYRAVAQHTNNPSFIAKSMFALAEVLEQLGRPQQAVDELLAYAERYGDEAQLAEAYSRIGMIFDRLGRLKDRFEIHTNAIKELISDASSEAVDELILTYIRDHQRYSASFADSRALLERLINEADFRERFLTDRAFQYQYMQSEAGIRVDRKLAQKLIRDREFRAKIIETRPVTDPATGQPIPTTGKVVNESMVIDELESLVEFYEGKAQSISGFEPASFFSEMMAAATRSDDLIRQMRAQMALDRLRSDASPPQFSDEELALAPPAVVLWEAAKYRESDSDKAKALYRLVLERHPYSKSVYNALLAIGDITFESAVETKENEELRTALTYYDRITERFAMRSETAIAHLRKGRLLSELGREAEAIDVLGQILRNPKWKGLDHAKAHLELGRAYRRQGQLSEAHGFFERLIVAYGGFAEPVSWAYYYDMLTLEDMNERESLQQLIEEFKTRTATLSETEAYALIDEKYEL